MRYIIFLGALCLIAAVSGKPPQQRIVGGSATTINNYPFAVAALNMNVSPTLACGGVILNNRSVLTSAMCFVRSVPSSWRLRVGSSFPYSGGNTYTVRDLIYHPDFTGPYEMHIGIFRLSSSILFGTNVQPGRFASANYRVPDNASVWTYGWGATSTNGPLANQLQHIQIRTVNYDVCRSQYITIAIYMQEYEMCAGNFEQGGQDICEGDFGGALLHNGNVVGVSSWGGLTCGFRGFPGVYTRVPNFIDWIVANS